MRRLGGLLVLALAVGCVPPVPDHPPLPPLQVRELQTRTYETTDTAMVTKALLNVLQDDGFIIQNANADLGAITANKEKTVREWHGGFLYSWDVKYAWICSVNITPFGQQTKVRVNVQVREAHGAEWASPPREVASEVDDPTYYRDFFAKVDKGIFIQKESL